jgi:hypothetical protein
MNCRIRRWLVAAITTVTTGILIWLPTIAQAGLTATAGDSATGRRAAAVAARAMPHVVNIDPAISNGSCSYRTRPTTSPDLATKGPFSHCN